MIYPVITLGSRVFFVRRKVSFEFQTVEKPTRRNAHFALIGQVFARSVLGFIADIWMVLSDACIEWHPAVRDMIVCST